MTKLAYLHEPGVLHNLACRFSLNEIYVSHIYTIFTVNYVINTQAKKHGCANNNNSIDYLDMNRLIQETF